MSGKIYIVTNLVNNKQYVGQTITDDKKGHGKLITEAYKKYGRSNFRYEILEECDYSDMDILEIKYIKEYETLTPNGYNIESGGRGPGNKSPSDEQRAAHSEKMKGKIPWNKGKEMSDDQRTKLRESIANNDEWGSWNKGHVKSKEVRENHSKKMKGRTPWNKGKKGVSAETKAKMSESAKKRNDLNRDDAGRFIRQQEK